MSDAGTSRVKSPAPSAKPLGNFSNTSKLSMTPNDTDTDMTDAPAYGAVAFGGKDDVKVEPFYGDRAKLIPFLTQLKVVYKLNPSKYRDAKTQVLYAAMQLKGAAQSWFQPMLSDYVETDNPDKDTMACFRNFAKFEELIKQVFGTVNEARAASRTIYTLRQKGSAASYFSEFQKVAKDLSWEDEDAFAEIFYNGLKESVRQKMMTPPTTYKEMVDEAIKIDNRLYELSIENRSTRSTAGRGGYNNQRGYHFRNHRRDYGDPMDLSNLNSGRASRANVYERGRGRKPNGRPNDREKERRRKDGLCFTCGKTGHLARDCQRSAQGLHMINMEGGDADGPVETKADTTGRTQGSAEDQGTTAQKDRQESDNAGALGESDIEDLADQHWNEFWGGKPKKPKKKTQAKKKEFEELLSLDKAKEAQYNARRRAEEHANSSWHSCYEDSCLTHLSSKTENQWFPHKEGGSMKPQARNYKVQETLAMMREGANTEIVKETGYIINIRSAKWEERQGRILFDPWMTPQPTIEEMWLGICRKEECPRWRQTHTHDTFTGVPYQFQHWKANDNRQCWDEIVKEQPDKVQLRTYRWLLLWRREDEEFCYHPEAPPRKDQVIVTLKKCQSNYCADKENSHTHSLIGCQTHRMTFKESGREALTLPQELMMIQENHDDDRTSGWVETQEEESEKDYEMVVARTHLLIFNTTYYEVRNDTSKEQLIFHPNGDRQKEKRPVRIRGCYDEECPRMKEYHSHDTADGTIINYNPQDGTIGGLPAKLTSLEDDEWEEITHGTEESEDEGPTIIVIRIMREWMEYVTNHWEAIPCEGCVVDPEAHEHIYYNSEQPPRGTIRISKVPYCRDEDCATEKLHAHAMGAWKQPLMVNPTATDAMRHWGTENPTSKDLGIRVEKIDPTAQTIDARANKQHVYRTFSCIGATCPMFYEHHHHCFNVSPDEPEKPLARGRYDYLLKEKGTCKDKQCRYAKSTHIHSKN